MRYDQTISWLFHPLSADEFLTDVWAKKHHVVRRNDPNYFESLFGAKALEDFLEYGRPEPSGVRMVKAKDKKDLQSYRLGSGAIDMVALRNDFAAGYTIIINGLERYASPVASIARGLEVDLNFETQVNAYVTPPGSQGFLPHYDDHDVVVLQTQGTKRWYIYEGHGDVPTCELQQREIFVSQELPPATELTLHAGDVLYVPRGRVHAAEALDETSIHLTIGIHPPNRLELIKAALDAMAIRDDRVLERLPPRYLNDPVQRARLCELARDLIAAIDDRALGEAVASIEDSLLRRGRCQPSGQFIADIVGRDGITTDSHLIRSQPLYARVMVIGGGIGLQFAQTMVTADTAYRDAMLYLSQRRDPFKVHDIPGLSGDQQVELARKLLVDGFLVQMIAA